MSVYQVEEYYIHIQFDHELSDEGKDTLKPLVGGERFEERPAYVARPECAVDEQ